MKQIKLGLGLVASLLLMGSFALFLNIGDTTSARLMAVAGWVLLAAFAVSELRRRP